jgi:hypothetical protein
VFATSGFIGIRHFIFREDSLEWALWYACTTVDADIGVNVIPGILILGVTRDNALYRADLDTTSIAKAQTCNNVCHRIFPPKKYYMKSILSFKPLGNFVPVNYIPPRSDEISAAILIFQVICMLPHIDAQEWDQPL